MDPKNVDRLGKGFLAALGAGLLAAAKKYGPTIGKGAAEIFKKIVHKG